MYCADSCGVHAVQEELALAQREAMEQLYLGTDSEVSYEPFSEVVPESKVSMDTFKWVASLVS